MILDVGTYAAPTLADIDGDGDQDLVVGNYDGAFRYFLNESTESSLVFTEQKNTDNFFNGFDVGTRSSPIFADIDRDGDLDLVAGGKWGNLEVLPQ